MVQIALHPVSIDNWRECTRLKVEDDQRHFVAHNIYSLAEAAYQTDYHLVPLVIYDGDTMVGFTMYGHPNFDGRDMWFIFRLMVDATHQGKGYGRAAMKKVIEIIKSKPDCDEIYVSYDPDNHVAAKLYAGLGFLDEGQMIEDEILVRLPVEK